ncbi:TIGR02391 family protein [Ramlibacter alkalitolerans]|uniref:TIGR02391 family protein n=1 Tax=Ramlibacter alkalitolerans TaxID=2039631 RepID=A0ABS1JMF6_9BURK|nr:TIGR02391 family protein [Ramlibacter alkalitolerans]MBL0425407.1 TIGR02391 family protein [Ramlibacter alkalitolerans]
MADSLAPFTSAHIEAVARVLGDTNDGLTGPEIGFILRDAEIPDVDSTNTKWKRLYSALASIQNEKCIGNYLIMFVNRAMAPVRYTNTPALFELRRQRLNAVLLLSGYQVREDGKVSRASAAQTLTEALQRANRLSAALSARGVHPDVLQFCRAELLQENYFHAVFEATKSIAAKVRTLSGLDGDGADLVQRAFGFGKADAPTLAINSLRSETDRGEQRGFVSLLVGLFGCVRNPLAHHAKVEWTMTEQDALDILTLSSLVHRKLDKAERRQTAPP